MQIVTKINNSLQLLIPERIGRFDDSFNPNCTGDQYSLLGTPTILIESGFYPEDYTREQTRRYVAEAIFRGIEYINDTEVTGEGYAPYFDIPENKKSFRDYCIVDDKEPTRRVYVQLEEQLSEGRIVFVPKVVDKSEGEEFYAHTTYKFSEICRYPNNDIYTMIPDILEYIRKEVEKI